MVDIQEDGDVLGSQGLVLTRKDTRGTRMMYLIDR